MAAILQRVKHQHGGDGEQTENVSRSIVINLSRFA